LQNETSAFRSVNYWDTRKRALEKRETAPMSVNIMKAEQGSSLKGDQKSAQGFNLQFRTAEPIQLAHSKRRALKRHQNPAHHIGSKPLARASSFSRHFHGAFLRDEYPGLKHISSDVSDQSSRRRQNALSRFARL
jgi:hypothetical protein